MYLNLDLDDVKKKIKKNPSVAFYRARQTSEIQGFYHVRIK